MSMRQAAASHVKSDHSKGRQLGGRRACMDGTRFKSVAWRLAQALLFEGAAEEAYLLGGDLGKHFLF